MKKSLLFIIIYLFGFGLETAYGQSFPMVINNTYIPPTINLYMRSGPGTSYPVLTSLQTNKRLVASGVTYGGTVSSLANLQPTSYWYRVDLPGTGSSAPPQCYVAAGSTFTDPQCGATYLYVNSNANIRTSAGASNPHVTIGGANAFVFSGQQFAVTGYTTVGVTPWYQIDLPDGDPPENCSQSYGWVVGTAVTTYTCGYNGLPNPTSLLASSITTTGAILNWSENYYPSGVYFNIYNYSSPLGTASAAGSLSYYYAPTNYTFSTLSACTAYNDLYVQASYGSCSPSSSTPYSFNTTCTCTTPSNPNTPTYTPHCGYSTISQIGSPPSGQLWYWQNTSCGTSTSYGYGSTFDVYSSGTYYLRAYNTSGGGCWSSGCSSVYVTVNSSPSFSTTSTNVTCSGCNNGSITVYASGGAGSYQYSDNGGSSWQLSNSFSFLSAGTYTVEVKDADNCTYSQIVTIYQPPQVTGISVLPTNNISAGTSVTFYGSYLYGPSTYLWTIAGGVPYSVITSTAVNPSIVFDNPGSYRITLQAFNSEGSSNVYSTGPNFITVNPSTTECLLPNNYVIQQNFPNMSVAEPIDIATGSYGYKHTDFNIPAINTSLNFTRYYNTVNNVVNSPLGYGWTHSYDFYISNQSDSLWQIHYGDGHVSAFIPLYGGSGNSFHLYGGTYETLYKNPSTGLFSLTFKTGEIFAFNSSGNLATITDLNGNITTLTYSGGLLTSVNAPGGRSLTFGYTGTNITSVTDMLGRTVSYSYLSGNLVSATDQNAHTTGFSYDGEHNILSIVTARGDTLLTNTYDSQNRVVTQSDALHQTTRIFYDPADTGHAIITYPGGASSTVHHDKYYRLINESDELGFTKSYYYDYNNNRDIVIDENGRLTSFTYDGIGNCLSVQQPLSATTQCAYNSFNKPVSIVDPLTNRDSLVYDAHGNLTDLYLPDGSSRHFNYVPTYGLIQTSTDGYGQITTYNYSAFGDLVTMVSPNGTRSFTYDLTGRPLSLTDENGHTTMVTYDSVGNIIVIKDPLNDSVINAYDADNNRVSFIDKNGNQTQFSYNYKDRLSVILDARGGNTVIGYDVRDNVDSVTDASNHLVQYGHDAKNRLTSITNSLGTFHIGYDAVGNKISDTDAVGRTHQYTYNALNQCTNSADALGNTTGFAHDLLGRITGLTDPLTRTTSYAYNPIGLVNNVLDANIHSTSVTYDLNGKQTSITNARTFTQYFRYDSSMRLTGYTDANSHVDSLVYDSVGNIKKEIKPTGTITKTYDAANRVINVANSTGDNYAYGYDRNGKITSATNNAGTSTFLFDSLNQLKQYKDVFNDTVTYIRNGIGKIIDVGYPGGNHVYYSYNNANLLDTVRDWLGHRFSYQYDGSGRLTNLNYPNGITSHYRYDLAGRLDTQVTFLGSTIINQSIFILNAKGERVQEIRTGPVAKHLTASANTNVFEKDDHIVSSSSGTYAFDGSGNRHTLTDSGTTTYYYSVDNLLDSITCPSGTISYVYDALGNRVERIQGGNITKYVLDLSGNLSKVIQTQSLTGTTSYIYGLGLLASIDAYGNILYYHSDAQKNTVALSNDSGRVTDSYSYLSSGKVLKHTGSTQQPFTFLGEYGVEQESPTLYYVHARYYDASQNGIFLNKDPYPASLANPQTLNRYTYGFNNPMSFFDPSGLCADQNNMENYTSPFWSGVSNFLSNPQITIENSIEKLNNYYASNNQSFKIKINNILYKNNNINNSDLSNLKWNIFDNFITPTISTLTKVPWVGELAIAYKIKYKKGYANSNEMATDIELENISQQTSLDEISSNFLKLANIEDEAGDYLSTWILSGLNFISNPY